MYGMKFVDTKDYTRAYYVPNTDVIAVIDGKEWTEIDVLEIERKLCLEGMSTRQIAMKLTHIGIPTQQGHTVWNRIVVLQHLTNGNYRGYPYAVNYRKTKEGSTSYRKTTEDEQIPLPEGIIPRLIEPEEFDAIQAQLARNSEMSSRNNKHPNDSLLRGLAYYGICGRKLQIAHYSTRPNYIDYRCKRNEGCDTSIIYHHYTGISVAALDDGAWEFCLPYLNQPTLVREYITAMREQVDGKDRSQALEFRIEETKEKIINLLSVAEVARDDTTRQLYRERLAKLEHDIRETETLLARLSNSTERNQKLLVALDKFEQWALSQQKFLSDPDYQITREDKRAVFLVLGLKATAWPSEGYPKRKDFELCPPDVQRFCDFSFQ